LRKLAEFRLADRWHEVSDASQISEFTHFLREKAMFKLK